MLAINSQNPSQAASLPEVIDSRNAAALLQVHLTTIQELAKRGEIPCCKVGKDYRFLRAALLDWVRGLPVRHPARR